MGWQKREGGEREGRGVMEEWGGRRVTAGSGSRRVKGMSMTEEEKRGEKEKKKVMKSSFLLWSHFFFCINSSRASSFSLSLSTLSPSILLFLLFSSFCTFLHCFLWLFSLQKLFLQEFRVFLCFCVFHLFLLFFQFFSHFLWFFIWLFGFSLFQTFFILIRYLCV